MRTNNLQKINELKNILQQIISKSKIAENYVIKQELEYGTLKIEVSLKNKEDEIFWKKKGTYFEVLCDLKLILYPLL